MTSPTLPRERTILALTVTAHALTHVAELAFPALAIIITTDFLHRAGAYGAIGDAGFFAALLFGSAALPSGRLVDRLGARRVLMIMLFGTAASLFALAAAPGLRSLTIVLAFLGGFAGLYHPAGTTMISLGVRQQGKAMGWHGMGGNLGLALTPLLAAALAGAVGWRVTCLALACLPLSLGVFVLASRIDVGHPASGPKTEPADQRYLLRPLALVFAMGVFNGMTYRGLMTFLPAYFTEKVHLAWLPLQQVTVGGAMTTAILLLGIAGQLLGGALADRFRKEAVYTGIFLLAAPVLLSLGFLENLPLVAATGLFAFLYFANQPVGNAIIPRYTGAGIRGWVYGLFFFASFGAGSIMSPIAGWIGERFHLASIFLILASTLGCAGLLGLGLVRASRNSGNSGQSPIVSDWHG
jgi:MFS family permease